MRGRLAKVLGSYHWLLCDDGGEVLGYVYATRHRERAAYRWSVDTTKFPNGLAGLANFVHGLGLKVGFYLTPGIPVAAVNQNTPIEGTSFHAKDIAVCRQ